VSVHNLYRTVLFLFFLNFAFPASHFSVIEKTEGETRISFSLGAYSTEEVEGMTRFFAADAGYTSQAGLPELMVYSLLYQMQPGIAYEATFEVVHSTILSDITVYPMQDLKKDRSDNAIQVMDDSFYSSGRSYPENNLRVLTPKIMRNLELLPVSVVPFKYHADSHELEVYDEIEISIFESGTREITAANEMPRSRVFEQLYASLIVNYEASDREEDYQAPAILYICGGGSSGAITLPAFQALKDWRHQRGYVVYTASTDETGSSNSDIKNYIQDAYETFDPPPEYVALVGDVGGSFNIPAYSVSGGDSDHPYTQLAGDDLLPEVLIGRISVNSATEMSIVASKTLNYEKAVYLENNWLERIALVGDPTHSGLSVINTNMYIAELADNFGYEEINENYSGGYASWMENQLESGLAYFNYRGYIGTSGFSCANINNANNGDMTPFVTFITCATGSFGWGEAISECFLRAGTVNNPKGGVAAIGTATASTHTAPNNIVDMGVYDGIFSQGLETGAGALFAGKLALYKTYPDNPSGLTSEFTGWNNLMGDPAVTLWTDTPIPLTADYPATIGLGTNYLPITVTTDGGDPIDKALVTLVTTNDEVFTSVYTDSFGMADIAITPGYTGNITVTVTKRNYIPIEGEVTVTNDGPAVNFSGTGLGINDSAGDGNGLANPGETLILEIPLINFGTESANGVQAWLDSDSELISFDNTPLELGDFDPGAESTAEFELTIAPQAPDMAELGLTLQIFDLAGDSWFSSLPLEIHGGRLLFQEYAVTSGTLFHGNTAEISVELNNSGSIGLSGVTAEVVYVPNSLEIQNGFLEWGDIPAGETVNSENSFTVIISPDIINGSVLPVELLLESEDGYADVVYLPLQVGETSVNEPLGPDEHGYYIYGTEDLGYNLALPYDWQEIDPDFGGSGTSLEMNDLGEGSPLSQSSAHVDLPFTFTFYGIDYDEITVSTNGWIGFGYNDLTTFRNYHIPGAGGPSPMLAVFWDDLKTTQSGQVYKYINAEEGYVIIEWSGLHSSYPDNPQTFQAILYDSDTITGDDEILLQYNVFNNTTVGDYSSYTPHHGCYSTIGIKNELGNMGLEYTFDNEYPPAAQELTDGSALFITTRLPMALMMGDVNQDGELNILDIIQTVNYIIHVTTFEPLQTYLANMNGDDSVNILDVIIMINNILD